MGLTDDTEYSEVGFPQCNIDVKDSLDGAPVKITIPVSRDMTSSQHGKAVVQWAVRNTSSAVAYVTGSLKGDVAFPPQVPESSIQITLDPTWVDSCRNEPQQVFVDLVSVRKGAVLAEGKTTCTISLCSGPKLGEQLSAPKNLKVEAEGSDSIFVSWDASNQEKASYVVFYRHEYEKHSTEKAVSGSNLTITNLHPDSVYHVHVVKVARDGTKIASKVHNCRTDKQEVLMNGHAAQPQMKQTVSIQNQNGVSHNTLVSVGNQAAEKTVVTLDTPKEPEQQQIARPVPQRVAPPTQQQRPITPQERQQRPITPQGRQQGRPITPQERQQQRPITPQDRIMAQQRQERMQRQKRSVTPQMRPSSRSQQSSGQQRRTLAADDEMMAPQQRPQRRSLLKTEQKKGRSHTPQGKMSMIPRDTPDLPDDVLSPRATTPTTRGRITPSQRRAMTPQQRRAMTPQDQRIAPQRFSLMDTPVQATRQDFQTQSETKTTVIRYKTLQSGKEIQLDKVEYDGLLSETKMAQLTAGCDRIELQVSNSSSSTRSYSAVEPGFPANGRNQLQQRPASAQRRLLSIDEKAMFN